MVKVKHGMFLSTQNWMVLNGFDIWAVAELDFYMGSPNFLKKKRREFFYVNVIFGKCVHIYFLALLV